MELSLQSTPSQKKHKIKCTLDSQSVSLHHIYTCVVHVRDSIIPESNCIK